MGRVITNLGGIMLRIDMRSEPVRRMVVMGEPNAYGMNAVDSDNQCLGSGPSNSFLSRWTITYLRTGFRQM